MRCDNSDNSGFTDLATRVTADLMNLDTLGRWPQGERANFIVWSMDHGASAEVLSRVLGVTRERVRQIFNQEMRKRT